MGRVPANTKLSANVTIRKIRTRGGNSKMRALRLDHGNYSWGSEAFTAKTRLLDVNYNASNNELVRTKTLVKNAIIQIDATPFRTYYKQKYGIDLSKKVTPEDEDKAPEVVAEGSKHVKAKVTGRAAGKKMEMSLRTQFGTGRLFACITSRPGQCGRCDGYILEGKELDFYLKKMDKKRK